jgi:hypothetical protein
MTGGFGVLAWQLPGARRLTGSGTKIVEAFKFGLVANALGYRIFAMNLISIN